MLHTNGVNYTNDNANTIINSPNPFSNSTTISFTLPQPQNVSILIYDINGRLIKTLANSEMQAGQHQFVWNAAGKNGNVLLSGIYFVKVNAVTSLQTHKIVLIK